MAGEVAPAQNSGMVRGGESRRRAMQFKVMRAPETGPVKVGDLLTLEQASQLLEWNTADMKERCDAALRPAAVLNPEGTVKLEVIYET